MRYTISYPGEIGYCVFGNITEEEKDEHLAAHPNAKVVTLVRPDWKEKIFTVHPFTSDPTVAGGGRYCKSYKVVCKPVYCNRCGGSGCHGPYRVEDSTCFKCSGTGFIILRRLENEDKTNS